MLLSLLFPPQELVCETEALVHQFMGPQHQQPHRQRGGEASYVTGGCCLSKSQKTLISNRLSVSYFFFYCLKFLAAVELLLLLMIIIIIIIIYLIIKIIIIHLYYFNIF